MAKKSRASDARLFFEKELIHTVNQCYQCTW